MSTPGTASQLACREIGRRLIRRGAGLGLESRHHPPEYDAVVMGHFCYDVGAVSQYVRTLPLWDRCPVTQEDEGSEALGALTARHPRMTLTYSHQPPIGSWPASAVVLDVRPVWHGGAQDSTFQALSWRGKERTMRLAGRTALVTGASPGIVNLLKIASRGLSLEKI